MNIKYTCTDCGAGLEPPVIRCDCCGDPYCEDCMAKRVAGSDSWLATIRQWLTDPPSMPLASLTRFAEDVIKINIDIAREDADEEEIQELESALESLNNGDMCIETIYSYASVGVLQEYDRVMEAGPEDEQGDTAD